MCYVGGSQNLCRVAAKKKKTRKLRLSKARCSQHRKRETRESARAIERERGARGGSARCFLFCEKREQAHKILSLSYHNLALPTSSYQACKLLHQSSPLLDISAAEFRSLMMDLVVMD